MLPCCGSAPDHVDAIGLASTSDGWRSPYARYWCDAGDVAAAECAGMLDGKSRRQVFDLLGEPQSAILVLDLTGKPREIWKYSTFSGRSMASVAFENDRFVKVIPAGGVYGGHRYYDKDAAWHRDQVARDDPGPPPARMPVASLEEVRVVDARQGTPR